MTKRKHMGIGYHHNGILVMSAIGLAVLYGDYLVASRDLAAIVLSVVCVGALMLLQLYLDYRVFEKDYVFYTTEQSSRPGMDVLKERIRLKWPALLVIPLFLSLRPLSVTGAFFLFMIMTYPLQRSMYIRSLKEFGSSGDSVN